MGTIAQNNNTKQTDNDYSKKISDLFLNIKGNTTSKDVGLVTPTLLKISQSDLRPQPHIPIITPKTTTETTNTPTATTTSTTTKTIPQEGIQQAIINFAKKNNIDPNVALQIAKIESSLNPNAINKNDGGSPSYGLYQIKWATALDVIKSHPELGLNPKTFTAKDLMNPINNIKIGITYYNDKLHQANGDYQLAYQLYRGKPNATSSATSTNGENSNDIMSQVKPFMQNFEKLVNETQKSNKDLLDELRSNDNKFQSFLKGLQEDIKTLNSPPAAKTYQEIVKENSKIMPLMATVIALGTAVFGHGSSKDLADNFASMFRALHQKNIEDWGIELKDAEQKLNTWKAETELKIQKINEALSLAVQGKASSDKIIEAMMGNNQTSLSNYLTLLNTTNTLLSTIGTLKYKAAEVALKQYEVSLKQYELQNKIPVWEAQTENYKASAKEHQAKANLDKIEALSKPELYKSLEHKYNSYQPGGTGSVFSGVPIDPKTGKSIIPEE